MKKNTEFIIFNTKIEKFFKILQRGFWVQFHLNPLIARLCAIRQKTVYFVLFRPYSESNIETFYIEVA